MPAQLAQIRFRNLGHGRYEARTGRNGETVLNVERAEDIGHSRSTAYTATARRRGREIHRSGHRTIAHAQQALADFVACESKVTGRQPPVTFELAEFDTPGVTEKLGRREAIYCKRHGLETLSRRMHNETINGQRAVVVKVIAAFKETTASA